MEQPLAGDLFVGQDAIEAEVARLQAEAQVLVSAGDFDRVGAVVAAAGALKQRLGAPVQAAELLAAVLRDRKLGPALAAAGREAEAALVAARAATMAAECTSMGGEVPAEEGEPPEAEDGMAAAAAYLPATVTDLQKLSASAEVFGLEELSRQCRTRLEQLESTRARSMLLHSALCRSDRFGAIAVAALDNARLVSTARGCGGEARAAAAGPSAGGAEQGYSAEVRSGRLCHAG